MLFENSIKDLYYIGLDLHKKKIVYCIKKVNGEIAREGEFASTRKSLEDWRLTLNFKWSCAMEATIFTGWVYDALKPYAHEIKVANPLMLKAISASKKKNDRLDAAKIADALRANLIPECYMAPPDIRNLRRCLRQRTFLVRQVVKLKNNTTGLLMMSGAEYNKKKVHNKGYFHELMENLTELKEVPESIIEMSRYNKNLIDVFSGIQKNLLNKLKNNILIKVRLNNLMTIPGVGEILGLTWILEIGDPKRFENIKKVISYCGLCSGQTESAGKTKREPISKQRNKNIQWVLIEAAKLAAWKIPYYKEVYEKAREKGNYNMATISVARKIAAYMFSVDKNKKPFEVRENSAAKSVNSSAAP